MAHPYTCHISFIYAPVACMWVVALHNLFLYSDLSLPCHPPSYWLRLFSSQTFPCINTPTFCIQSFLAWLGLIQSFYSHLPAYEDETDNAPKRRHIKFRRRGITQKKAYNSLVNNCITVVSFNSTLSKPIIQGVLVNL